MTGEELTSLDLILDSLANAFEEDRRQGDLIEFLTELSEALKQGKRVTIYAKDPS